MELDVTIGSDSLSVPIDNPFRLDVDGIVVKIEAFCAARGASLSGLDLGDLIPKMVRGIAGCESGCPANAMGLVSRGVRNFDLAYVEGGILTARAVTEEGKKISLRMFPEF